MSDLRKRNPNLAKIIEGYPPLVQSAISFLTEDACIGLLSIGGQTKGYITLNIVKGQVVSMVPAMEIKTGFEIPE